MRRVCALSLCVIMVLVFTACGSSTGTTWQEQYDLGMQYLTEGDYSAAIVALTTAIETDPKMAAFYIARGDAYSAWAEETLTAALDALADGDMIAWSEVVTASADGNTYTLEKLYENAINDYEEAISLLESGDAIDDSQEDLLEEAIDKHEAALQKEQESKNRFELEIIASEVTEVETIEISEYLTSYKTLADTLEMEKTDPWQFGSDTSYERDGFYLEWDDSDSASLFGMKNSRAENVLLYGISLGDNVSDAVEILENERWWAYPYGTAYTALEEDAYCDQYFNYIDGVYYLLEVVYDDNDQIMQWYLNNWPELVTSSEYIYEQVFINATRKDYTDSYESILEEYREACSAGIDALDYYVDVAGIMFDYYAYNYGDDDFYYIYYDINQDGQNELILGYGTDDECEIVDIYTYDGVKVHKAVDSSSLAYRARVRICTDGTMIYEGSGGAAYYTYDFLKIKDDGYSIEMIASYDGDWSANPNAPYYDGNQYLTEEEMENVLNAYSMIDSSSFEWIPLVP